jgi:hypothetical protein
MATSLRITLSVRCRCAVRRRRATSLSSRRGVPPRQHLVGTVRTWVSGLRPAWDLGAWQNDANATFPAAGLLSRAESGGAVGLVCRLGWRSSLTAEHRDYWRD